MILEFRESGPCVIDVPAVCKAWDHRFLLSQWGEEFRLIKYARKGSSITSIKCTISPAQANELIAELKLVKQPEYFFSSGHSWRKADWDHCDMMRVYKRRIA